MADPNEFNAQVIAEFRANAGEVGGGLAGAPVLLLHSTGAKSGEARLHPLMYQAVGDAFAIFASYAGVAAEPGLVPQPRGASGDDGRGGAARSWR